MTPPYFHKCVCVCRLIYLIAISFVHTYTHSHQEIISYTLKAEAVLWIINNWMPKICIVADVGGGGGGDW